MTELKDDTSPRLRAKRPVLRWWLRAAVIVASIAVIVSLNSVVDCAGLMGAVESTGRPLTFLVYDRNTNATTFVAHGVLVDLAVWSGIVLGIWYCMARVAERKPLHGHHAGPTQGDSGDSH